MATIRLVKRYGDGTVSHQKMSMKCYLEFKKLGKLNGWTEDKKTLPQPKELTEFLKSKKDEKPEEKILLPEPPSAPAVITAPEVEIKKEAPEKIADIIKEKTPVKVTAPRKPAKRKPAKKK